MELSVPELNLSGVTLRNFAMSLPSGNLSSDEVEIRGIKISDVEGSFETDMSGSLQFLLYSGRGRSSFNISSLFDEPRVVFNFRVEGIDLSSFVGSLSEDIFVSGIMDVEGSVAFSGGVPFFDVTFMSRRKRGVRQIMNFGAVRFIASMSGGTPAKTVGRTDFAYSNIAGRAVLQDGYLTLHGLAGESGGRNFIVRSGLFGGINLAIDSETNTIKFEDLLRRIKQAAN